MIVFINGSFGVGKTTVAQMLVRQLPNSLLYDAEEVGFMLRNILQPVEWSGDFQDYPLWRLLTVEVAGRLIQAYGRTLVMPMTIRKESYFIEVMSGLRAVDQDVHHFCLTAPVQIIRNRIFARGEQRANDWIFDQLEDCVTAFRSDLFAAKIDSSTMSAEQIVQYIITKIA